MVEKRRCVCDICPEDAIGRSTHKNYPYISNVAKQTIRDHICMFPAYTSHYSRSHTSKKYLLPDLSMPKTYCLYIEHSE